MRQIKVMSIRGGKLSSKLQSRLARNTATWTKVTTWPKSLFADTAGKCVPEAGSAYSSALADLSEPVQRHVLDFRLLPQKQ